jgi:hypothetical protein
LGVALQSSSKVPSESTTKSGTTAPADVVEKQASSTAVGSVYGGILVTLPLTGEKGPLGFSLAINHGIAGDWNREWWGVAYFPVSVIDPGQLQGILIK